MTSKYLIICVSILTGIIGMGYGIYYGGHEDNKENKSKKNNGTAKVN